MRTPILRFVAAAALLAFPTLAAAQVVEQTIRINPGGESAGIQLPMGIGGPRQFKTGTGRIRGRVLAADSGGPIRRAQVRISGQDVAPKAALTDAEGRFEFRELPAGRFTLHASKPGFMSVQFGQTRPFQQGTPIELADRQVLDKADISMPRGSVISGRIVDEFGDAVPDASVTALRLTWSNGRRRLLPSPGRVAQTNDLGQYRIYGLPPGDYYVSASMQGANLEFMAMEAFELRTGVAASGPSASTPRSGYGATYYPGTPNATEAQKITLTTGQEASSADFALVPVRLARVSGVVLSSDGRPLEGVAVSLVSASRDSNALVIPMGARTTREGAFTLSNIPPGDYTLQARSLQIITSDQGNSTMVFRAATVGGSDGEFGSAPLSISGEDLSNIVLATSKGGTAVGRVTFDGQRPENLNAFRIASSPADGEGPMLGGGFATVKEDGTFELKGLSGHRLFALASAPPGWVLKSVRLNGTDITDTGAEFKAGEAASGLELEVTTRRTTVAGGVTAADGSVVKDYTVIVFSESPELWRTPRTRWVNGARPDQDGRFKFQHMPAGTYYAIAVDYVPQGEWGDPELLDRLKAKAKRFTLDEGGTQTLDLKLTNDY